MKESCEEMTRRVSDVFNHHPCASFVSDVSTETQDTPIDAVNPLKVDSSPIPRVISSSSDDCQTAGNPPVGQPFPETSPLHLLLQAACSSEELKGISDSGVTKLDVLCGRGGLTNNHYGNRIFRQLVSEHRPRYCSVPKSKKAVVSQEIVREIRSRGGRFLRKNENCWYDVGDKKAIYKTSQALREGHTTSSKSQGNCVDDTATLSLKTRPRGTDSERSIPIKKRKIRNN